MSLVGRAVSSDSPGQTIRALLVELAADAARCASERQKQLDRHVKIIDVELAGYRTPKVHCIMCRR